MLIKNRVYEIKGRDYYNGSPWWATAHSKKVRVIGYRDPDFLWQGEAGSPFTGDRIVEVAVVGGKGYPMEYPESAFIKKDFLIKGIIK